MSSPPGQPGDQEERAALIAQILAQLGAVAKRLQSDQSEEWHWIAAHAPSARVCDLLHEATPASMRVLDAVGQLEPVNGATIAARYGIPKGTVSKAARRLASQALIRSEARPHNKKERLFHLTPLGDELVKLHRAFDAQMERGFVVFLQRYSPDELALLARVLADATVASFVALAPQHVDVEGAAEA